MTDNDMRQTRHDTRNNKVNSPLTLTRNKKSKIANINRATWLTKSYALDSATSRTSVVIEDSPTSLQQPPGWSETRFLNNRRPRLSFTLEIDRLSQRYHASMVDFLFTMVESIPNANATPEICSWPRKSIYDNGQRNSP